MSSFQDNNRSQDKTSELREKIQDEAYISTAIERIAEMMTKELFPEQETLRYSTSKNPDGSLAHQREYFGG